MTNLEIDRKLAEAMGYKTFEYDIGIRDGHEVGILMVPDDEDEWRYFRPTEDMRDAWDVFNHFGFDELYRSLDTWVVMKYGTDTVVSVNASSNESAAKAICLAALKVI